MTESEIRFVVTDDPDGGFDAHAVGHAIFTQADTLDDLRENVRDAVRCHFGADERPSVIRLDVGAGETLAA